MTQTGPVLIAGDIAFPRWQRTRSLIFLLVLTVGMAQSFPAPVGSGRGLVVLVSMIVGGAAWAGTALLRRSPRVVLVCVTLCAAAGLAASGAGQGLGPSYLLVAAVVAVNTMPFPAAAAVAAAQAAGLAIVLGATHAGAEAILLWTAGQLLLMLVALVRRQRDERTEQTRLLAAETQLAKQEQARSEALAERARVAREIHDVLAHSLSALSVQLETAAALLERERPADAAVIVDRAGRLARDGLTETRRAVSALRGDPLPLPELVAELAEGYRTDLSAEATVTVRGEPRAVSPETGLALYRSAQEALTNVRKHAPGSAVSVVLDYADGEIRLTVANNGSHGPALTGLSSGYGLTGLRERAELAGGSMAAAPDGDGWRVDVRMPG
ncbi:sensor histidine kinase [Asanoa sp. NPDC049573]|uniref:sensor histidine kinase n=1 Tax=Asanoa sp. NPDC049573 TaxID=3155396 RepID=UPI003416D223